MESNKNTFILKIPFKSNKIDKADFKGYVLYSFINGKLNTSKWNVTAPKKDIALGWYKSISAISKQITDINISGACKKREASLVVIDDNEIKEKYFYPILTRAKINNCNNIPRLDKIEKNVNWNENTITLKEALKRLPEFSEIFYGYNK